MFSMFIFIVYTFLKYKIFMKKTPSNILCPSVEKTYIARPQAITVYQKSHHNLHNNIHLYAQYLCSSCILNCKRVTLGINTVNIVFLLHIKT